jgi:serine phosphatase RsbU (regulator of sigma subunit)
MNVKRPESINDNWPKAELYPRSIRKEFSLYISGLLMILMLAAGLILTDKYVAAVARGTVEKLVVQTRSYSGPAGKHLLTAYGPDAMMLGNTCGNLTRENPDIYWAAVAAADGRLVAHSEIREVVAGKRLPEWSGQPMDEIIRAGEKFAVVGDTIRINVPIWEGAVKIGSMEIAAAASQIREARRAAIIATISVIALLIVVGLPVSMYLLQWKMKPIRLITDHLKKIDFDKMSIDIPLKSKNEFGYLADTLRVMGDKLYMAQREKAEKERIAREYEIAREIQSNILPRNFPSSPRFEFAGAYRSAKEVGGDYYDFIDYGDGFIGILIADVSGKSLPGMLVMLMTRDIIRQVSRSVRQPGPLLSAVNRELAPNIKKGMFVTMSYGLLNISSGDFVFASAGHNPYLHYDATARRIALLRSKGFPLGIMPPRPFEARLEVNSLRLSSGDWLALYTDGINEAQNENNDEFGMDRFLNLIRSNADKKAEDLVRTILESVENFVGSASQSDDITLLTMKWLGIEAETGTANALERNYAR